MPDLQIRPTIASDLPRLMGFDHTIASDFVWQLELRREGPQISAVFREVRLPRPVTLAYPRNPFALADDWIQNSMMFTAVIGPDLVGYISLLERGAASPVWAMDLVVDANSRRKGVASALLNVSQNWAQERSHRRLILEMQSKNVPAIRFAQKFGYEFCGYNDQYYPTQDVVLFFSKSLKP
jgi:GNAT superfamily N-acetyltransferase